MRRKFRRPLTAPDQTDTVLRWQPEAKTQRDARWEAVRSVSDPRGRG